MNADPHFRVSIKDFNSLVGLLRQLHVYDDALDRDRLIRNVQDLAAGDVVLVICPPLVEPDKMLDGRAVRAVVLEDFGGHDVAELGNRETRAPVLAAGPHHDRGWREPLSATGDFATDRRVDQHLAAIGRNDVEVLDRAGLVVDYQPVADISLLGSEAIRPSFDFHPRLADAGRRFLWLRTAAAVAHDQHGDERQYEK